MNLKQITPGRFTNSRLLTHEASSRKLLIKVFLGKDRDQRKTMEARKLIHWKAAGFCVPELVDFQFSEVMDPYLVMEFVAGETLKNFLTSETTTLERRLDLLSDLFSLNYRRHVLARAQGDLLLIHTDPNTDNILVSRADFYFIDFEHASKITDIASAIANEVGMFVRRVIRDLGMEHRLIVIERLLTAYHYDAEIFDKVEELTLGRPYQTLHRIKDRLKRLKNSRSVTRYDVVDSIRQLRRRSASGQPAN